MRKMNLALLCMMLLLYCFSCAGEAPLNEENDPQPQPQPEETTINAPDIFRASTGGYSCFRIPAITITSEKTLLAFAEARKRNCKDEGDIDLVLRRSTDNGKSWSPLIMVWDDGENTCGNPVPITDPETGHVHLLMTWNLGEDDIGEINAGTSSDTRRVFHSWSDDDGLTWTTPREITSMAKEQEWGWYATGPCHGIMLTREPYKGRMVVPCDYIEVGPGRKQYSHIIYSDDKGATWHIGGRSEGGNESTVAELSDGRLLLNMRNSSPFRTVAYSSDGGESWTASRQDYALPDPRCQASILNTSINGAHLLFFSNAAGSTRSNMTLRQSSDDGATWNRSHLVHSGPSAYSDIVMVNENEIGILYERGYNKPYEKISFEKINRQKIK